MREELTTQQRIKAVAERFHECRYIFGNWAQLNADIGDIDKPTIFYLLPPSGNLHPRNRGSVFIDKPSVSIAFLIPSDFDFDGELNDDKVEMMKILACMFIRALNESGYFEYIDEEDIPYKVFYNTTDDNVTGIMVELAIESKIATFCNETPFGFDE